MITTAGKVAIELRKLADALDKEPESPSVSASIYFSCPYAGKGKKEAFLNLAKLLPRPLIKRPANDEYRLEGGNDTLDIQLYIDRNAVCTLIEPARPAVYDCPSILSAEEEAALGPF